MKDATKTKLMIYAIIIVVGGTIAFLIYTAKAIEKTGDIKMRTYVTADMYHAVGLYLQENDGRWPESWDDLAAIADHPEWHRPDLDPAFCQEWVHINFDYKVSQLAQTDYAAFKAILPKGESIEGFLEERYPKLVDAAKSYDAGANEPDTNTVSETE